MGRAYFLTALLLLCFGLLYTLLCYPESSLRLAGAFMAYGGCCLFNLLYFLPMLRPALRLLLPGVLGIVVFTAIHHGSSVERNFFNVFAVTNLLLGIVWLVAKPSKR